MLRISFNIVFSLFFFIAINAQAEHWSTGFYRSSGDNEVYFYNDEVRTYCHVQNLTQLSYLTTLDQVRVIGSLNDFLSLSVSLNECTWPDGYYKTSDSEALYRLYPGKICQITTPEMLAAYNATNSVITAEPGSDFSSHRTDIGQCYWPY